MIISKNRYLDAFLKFVLLTAVIHMFLLFAAAIMNADMAYLNYFNILDIDLFFPGVEQGLVSQLISIAAMALVYAVIYLYFTGKEK